MTRSEFRWTTTQGHGCADVQPDTRPHEQRIDLAELRTYNEGVTRAVEHNRKRDRCPAGHEMTEANVYRHDGRRHCRACNALNVGKSQRRTR